MGYQNLLKILNISSLAEAVSTPYVKKDPGLCEKRPAILENSVADFLDLLKFVLGWGWGGVNFFHPKLGVG